MIAERLFMALLLIFAFCGSASAIDYFSYRMNFPPDEQKEHLQTITFTGNLTVTIPSSFALINYSSAPSISGNNRTWSSATETTINYTLLSPSPCIEGSLYHSEIYNNGSYIGKFTYVCLHDNKIVDHKVEYGHGCANYLTESCISNETATIFNLLRVWNIGNYLDPDEDARNAAIVCYYENFPVRTYGRVEVNYTPDIVGTYLWDMVKGGYWFRVGVLSQDVQKQAGESYNVSCNQMAYKFEHEQVIADFENYSLNVVSTQPFAVTYQNYTLDATKYVYTIKNTQSCYIYTVYFNRFIDGYTKTEFFPKLGPGEEIMYIGDKLDNNTFTINYIPSWYSNSMCPVIYTQEVKLTPTANHPPNITWTQPNQTASINETYNQTFYMNYTDADNDTLTVRWYVNGTLVQTETDAHPYGTSNYIFTTDCASEGTYNITATVSDSQYNVYYNWTLTVNNSCYCGDSVCVSPESCSTCPGDCGVCPITCGNGVCDGGESCSTCPGDCGSCGGGGGCNINIICREWQPQQCPKTEMQTRYCYDKNKCTKKNYTESRSCVYIIPCLNGVQDSGEEGVDCGGECAPCGSCFNKIQDLDETNVDCGGSYCPPCPTCSDGIKNQGEYDTDCGGPCQPCPCMGVCPEIRIPGGGCRDIIPSWIILIILLGICVLCNFIAYNYTSIKESIIKRKRKKSHKRIDFIEKIIIKTKRIGNGWKANLLWLILFVWLIFLLPLIDKGCYECRIISSRLLLTIFLAVIIIKLIIKLFSLTFKNNLIVITLRGYKNRIIQKFAHRRFCGYYCRKIAWMLLLLALIIILYLTYANCPAATCIDLVKNHGELGVDCGGSCESCPIVEKPAGLCGIPPWQVTIIILFAVFLAFLTDYITYLIAKWKNKDLVLYEYIKNSKILNITIAVILLMAMLSILILDRQCFECREIKSAYILILLVFLLMMFMIYRLYSKAKGIHILGLCKYKGIRLIIVLFVVIAASATLLDLYAYCPASTCNDGIQNQMEKGADCGGPCVPCLQERINPYAIMLLLVLLLVFLILYTTHVYYKYKSLTRVYNIELCPRCGTHMHRKGWLKIGIGKGRRTVYVCPRCEYRCIRNEHEINKDEKICPECETEMKPKNIRMFGNIIGKIYTCQHCGQRRIRIRFFE